eukprot:NODE_2147_length_1279_cov_24.558537_g1954_i0.p1 GENE.NODE_2147_length_1279_cov_24.558537_g1954_i0~~NODE_2147_length_1279_cov_24.558537_g1954_i0.p1  ORF type:complete len:190 (+),score=41.34 NODE_2147_length_1279_cov_24.558537_g1954_i0:101-670(+)
MQASRPLNDDPMENERLIHAELEANTAVDKLQKELIELRRQCEESEALCRELSTQLEDTRESIRVLEHEDAMDIKRLTQERDEIVSRTKQAREEIQKLQRRVSCKDEMAVQMKESERVCNELRCRAAKVRARRIAYSEKIDRIEQWWVSVKEAAMVRRRRERIFWSVWVAAFTAVLASAIVQEVQRPMP